MTTQFPVSREQSITRLRHESFDLLVVGGGITGVGVARDAALRGLRVALVERKDFGWGTSSRSSKLFHGGLRYLAYKKFGLVREALRERKLLINIAPHLAQPLRFLVPIIEGEEKLTKSSMTKGLFLYDLLALGRRLGKRSWHSPAEALMLEPTMREEGLEALGSYYDSEMNDARFTIENALSAQEHGAVVVNYTKVVGLDVSDGLVHGVTVLDLESGDQFTVQTRSVVNATGPWADSVCRLEDPSVKPKLANSKGSHIIVPKVLEHHHAVVIPMDDGRIIFVLPFGPDEQFNMIGTTDIFFGGDLDQCYCSPAEVEYLLAGYNKVFPKKTLSPSDLLSSFAGVRPLVLDPSSDDPSAVSREHQLFVSEAGLITIVGGKYTTYRQMAEETVDEVVKYLKKRIKIPPLKKPLTAKVPLVGGKLQVKGSWHLFAQAEAQRLSSTYSLPDDVSLHLLYYYGSQAEVVAGIAKEKGLDQRLLPDRPYIRAEVLYCCRHEMLRTMEDFFWLHTFIALEGQFSPAVDIVGELMSQELGWSVERLADEKRNVLELGRRARLET